MTVDQKLPWRAKIGLRLARPWLIKQLTEQRGVWEAEYDAQLRPEAERFQWGVWCAIRRLIKGEAVASPGNGSSSPTQYAPDGGLR